MKIEFNKIKQQFRKFHRIVAPIVFLPLFLTVITGIAYRLSRNWFGLSKDQTHFLMVIHEGGFLGNQIKPFYVLLDGMALIWMLITGIVISGLFSKKGKNKPTENTESKAILTKSEN
ncbi:PepSY domain-containing protein [Dapis sp. BLCC M229]|uniref:PepSY domain-containing protein n=1 Tax=Dapis sp. BLCC M229 TaxID=3400188 RepID=UPI003CEC2396